MANTESATVTVSLQFDSNLPSHVDFPLTLERPTYANFPDIVDSVSLPSLPTNQCGCSIRG